MFHTICQQPDSEWVWSQAKEVLAFCEQKFPHVANYLEEALDELIAFTNTRNQCGKKSGRITPLNGSIEKSDDAQMLLESSPIVMLSCASLLPWWQNNTMTGYSNTATCQWLALSKPKQ